MNYNHVPDYTCVECSTRFETRGLIEYLRAMGVPIHHTSDFDAEDLGGDLTYPNVLWDNGSIGQHRDEKASPNIDVYNWVSIDEFVNMFKEQPLPTINGSTVRITPSGRALQFSPTSIQPITLTFTQIEQYYNQMAEIQEDKAV